MKLLIKNTGLLLLGTLLFTIIDSANAQVNNSEAYQRRQQMLADRNDARKLADSTFLYVANMKDYIRDLKNKRNRARSLANAENANIAELRKQFNALLRNVDGLKDVEEVKEGLVEAVDFKKEIYQLETKGRKAESVAKKLDKQIKIKTKELERLNQDASKMQMFSAKGDIASSLDYYSNVKRIYNKADTLSNFYSEIILIAQNKVEYETPESVLAFADVILKQKENVVLMVQQTPVINSPKPVIKTVQEIAYNDNLYLKTEMTEESLEISFTVDFVIPKIVEQVSYNELAYSDTEVKNDNLEINNNIDIVAPKTVDEITYNEFAYSDTEVKNDNLEINNNIDIVAPKAVDEITYNELAYSDTEAKDENLEVDLLSDENEISNNIISNPLIKLDLNHRNSQVLVVTEVNMDSKSIDENPDDLRDLASVPTAKKRYKSSFDGVGLLTGKGLYFRSLPIAVKEIETSMSDAQLLKAALENSEILTYEELLYAASSMQSPMDGLTVLEMAFLRTDRDWRAYNNAAVIAININEFEQAQNYLFQAALLSTNNGKVENNKGVIAFYQGDFLEAEAFFNMARNYGVQTDQNINVLNAAKTIYQSENNKTPNHGSQNSPELMGDIIEYFPSGN